MDIRRRPFSWRRLNEDGAVFLGLWLALFVIARKYSHLCAAPLDWTLPEILVAGAAQDVAAFLIVAAPWFALQWLAQGSPAARYCPLALLAAAAVAALLNAMFVAWARTPVDHTFLTYLADAKALSASAADFLLTPGQSLVFALALGALLALAWAQARRSPPAAPRPLRRWFPAAVWLCAGALVAAGLFVRGAKRGPRADRHGRAIAANVFAHELVFAATRIGRPPLGAALRNAAQEEAAAASRAALVEDRGDFDYLDARYPLAKRNRAFSRPDARLAAWDRPPPAPPNVVLIFMESFRARDIGVYGGATPGLTPRFDALAAAGWLWENAYAAGCQTPRGALATLCSIYDYYGESVQRAKPALALCSLAAILKEQGYCAEYYYGGPLGDEKQVPFFRNLGYDQLFGCEEMFPQFVKIGWGMVDALLAERLAERLNAQPAGEPLFLTAFTITHHHPWPVPHERFRIVPGAEEYDRFRNSMRYADYALGTFFDRLGPEALNRTVFVLLADTAAPMGEHERNFSPVYHLYEENVRIPLLIYAPGFIAQGRRFAGVASQVDVMPTLLDLLGIECDNHAVGRSLLAADGEPCAFFSNPWFEGWAGVRVGRHKYLRQFDGARDLLFDLEADPDERTNIAPEHPQVTASLRQRTLDKLHAVQFLIEEERLWPR